MTGKANAIRLISMFTAAIPSLSKFSSCAFASVKETGVENFRGEESQRLTIALDSPRRFATRYLAQSRTLQITVSPAKASEFETTRFYDSRYVLRMVVEERNNAVTLSLQLKNAPLEWLVTPQDEPWRLMIDVWRTEAPPRTELDTVWNWQEMDSGSTEQASRDLRNSALPKERLKNDTAQIGAVKPFPPVPPINNNQPPKEIAQVEKTEKSAANVKHLENFGPLDPVVGDTPARRIRIANLERTLGQKIGTFEESDIAPKLAQELYLDGQYVRALQYFRRTALLNERQFKENAKALWLAGESAYLSQQWDLSRDYLRSLVMHFPDHELTGFAKLRLNDIDVIEANSGKNKFELSEKYSNNYVQIALSEKFPWQAKIAASVHLLHGIIDENPEAAKLYQQNLNACVKRSIVPIELQKNCAYILTRHLIEKMDVVSSDFEVQNFKKSFPNDPRSRTLELTNENIVRSTLVESHKNKAWESWIALEKKARPGLLEFTLKNGQLVFARAESWEAVGEINKATQLYSLYWQMSTDDSKRNEAAAVNARLLLKSKNAPRADQYLKRLEDDDTRQANGLTDRATGAVRELALAPYRNRRALRLVLDEMRAGRFVERELNALGQYAKLLGKAPAADSIYEKILAYPAKTASEIKDVEDSILRYAENLRDTGRFSKSGDMFLAVANFPQGSRKAESAYKAGIVYARAGLLEKARTAWQLAASDLGEKRFSTLANERLERIR